jgi:hypothetical protein
MHEAIQNPSWFDTLHSRLIRIAASDLRAVLVILLLVSLLRPYQGIVHDATLYAAQSKYQFEPERWKSDIFFRYGNQDRFTLFTKISGPLTQHLGLWNAFALMYFIGLTFFVFAVWMFCRRMFGDRFQALLASLAMLLVSSPFGGHAIMHAFEPFVTPRLFAIPFGLIAITMALDRRWPLAGLALLGCAALHPLYLVGPTLLVFGIWSLRWPAVFGFTSVLGIVGVSIVLSVPALAERGFGIMSQEWKDMVRAATPYNFPSCWSLKDWIRLAIDIAILGLGVWKVPQWRQFLSLSIALLILAVIMSSLAEWLPYRLFFQGQPYRWLWFPQWLAVVVLVKLFLRPSLNPWMNRIVWFVFTVWCYCADEQNHALIAGLIASVASILRFKWHQNLKYLFSFALICLLLNSISVIVFISRLIGSDSGSDYVVWTFVINMLSYTISGIVKIIIACVILGCLPITRWFLGFQALCTIMIIVTAAKLQELRVPVPGVRVPDDILYVSNIITTESNSHKQKIYWATLSNGAPMLMWHIMDIEPYISLHQCSGLIFNEETAIEGKRRFELTRAVELERVTSQIDMMNETHLRIYFGERGFLPEALPSELPSPTADDFRRIANEDLDWIVSKTHIPELNPITNGSIYIYDARKLRQQKNPIANLP